MEDSAIIDLYWAREERALSETDTKYGGYCRSIAHNILRNREDTEECVSDTWLHAWNAMPPHRPERLSGFLGKLTRRISLKRWEAARAQKRFGDETALEGEELEYGDTFRCCQYLPDIRLAHGGYLDGHRQKGVGLQPDLRPHASCRSGYPPDASLPAVRG